VFHNRAVATGNARSPRLDRLVADGWMEEIAVLVKYCVLSWMKTVLDMCRHNTLALCFNQ